MFELLFHHPWAIYRKSDFVLLRGWPVWVLALAALALAAWVAWTFLRRPMAWRRSLVLGALQWAALAILLIMLWQPALSVSELKPQQNVIAVVVDTSKSMALEHGRSTRMDAARRLLTSGLLDDLRKKYPIRLYAGGGELKRVENAQGLEAKDTATRLGDLLEQSAAESATLPVGAIVLLSDGADNQGGLTTQTTTALKRTRIPVHTIGFGSTKLDRDVEISSVEMPLRSLPGARQFATVAIRQSGYPGSRAKLSISEGGKTVATREIVLPADGAVTRQVIPFTAGAAGAHSLRAGIEPLDGETNKANNQRTRLLQVDDRKPRILQFEGEPRWEYKFIRRAAEADPNLALASILRTTQNKFYRQGVANPKDLEEGFPTEVEEIFSYEGLVIGAVEAGYFTPSQQALIREFAGRRGGGVLFLGGRTSLSDGGWQESDAAEMLPVILSNRKGTFHRDPAQAELAQAGRDSLLTRIEDNPEKNAARWKTLPALADYQESGALKPGAVLLAEAITPTKARVPLLVTQNYGRGRVAMFATGGSWRWQMLQDSKDQSHEMFWQQMLRWLAADVTGRVTVTVPKPVFSDETNVRIRAEVRDTNYLPASDASVEARILGPGGAAASLELRPDPMTAGVYAADWKAEKTGTWVIEAVARRGNAEVGRHTATILREDGVQEDFATEQNRPLLERISEATGGRYYTPDDARKLIDEISLSDAGISVRENYDLWNIPAVFLLLVGLKAGEWLLRRRWGAI